MPRPSLEIGSTLASYTIEAVLGRGGMGSVYLATQKHLKRKAALKVLSPDLATDDEYRGRFLRECELIAQLEHPNIVPIYDAGEADGLLYLAMRYIKGTDLRALISERGHLSAESTLAIVEQIASALDAAHAAGVIHRDVKPANILIERPGERAYLSDFGVAKSLSSDGLTRTGTFLGTVDYCAPEQISGKPIDAGVDGLAGDLLGGAVVDRTQEGAGASETVGGKRLGHSEVAQIGALTWALDQDVGGLDVAVDDACGVSGIQGGGDLLDDGKRGFGRKVAALTDQGSQVGALDVAHGQIEQTVCLARVVDRDDVWVL